MPPTVTAWRDGASFAVRVVPRASRTAVDGTRGDALLIRLTAPPVDNAANDALAAALASLLDVPRRSIVIVSGQSSRDKRVGIAGCAPHELAARLAAIL